MPDSLISIEQSFVLVGGIFGYHVYRSAFVFGGERQSMLLCMIWPRVAASMLEEVLCRGGQAQIR